MFKKISIIGAGVMGEALIQRLVEGLRFPARSIVAADPTAERLEFLKKKYRITTADNNTNAVKGADLVILAIKPQQAQDVLTELGPHIKKQVFLSIMAGVSLKALRHFLGSRTIVRCMPNMPAQIGAGMTVWTALPGVSKSQKTMVQKIIAALGAELEVKNEKMIDAATAVSGSGPAYVFDFASHLIEAAKKLGFSEKDAALLVKQTLYGASCLLQKSPYSPAELRQKVTSKGGTTAAAFAVLDEAKQVELWEKAVSQAWQRAVELKNDIENKK